MMARLGFTIAIAFVLSGVTIASAQQITVGTPLVNVGDRFFESSGLGFGFNLSAAQGSSRTLSATAGSLTVTNGVPGFFVATTQRPFVTGLIPVVGEYGGGIAPVFGPAALMPISKSRTSAVRGRINRLKAGERPTPGRLRIPGDAADNHDVAETPSEPAGGFQARLKRAQSSSAGRTDLSVAEIRRQQAANDMVSDDKLTELHRKAAAAVAAGKPHVSRIYQQQINRRSEIESISRNR
jgi:hypothetical protein